MTKRIAVLFGGQASEHPVSLMSAYSVLSNLDKEKFEAYMVGITKDGKWFHFTGSIDELDKDLWMENANNQQVILSPSPAHHGFYNMATNEVDYVDAIFPVLHGKYGEDGSVQGLCVLNGIPCVSSNMTSCANAMDKDITHVLCENAGIPMAKYKVLYRDHSYDFKQLYKQVEEELAIPCYVKPAREGSSFGAHKINNYEDFIKYIDDAFSYDDKILLEEFIEGTEVGCGVIGEETAEVVYEVVVETEMYGFTEKYDGYKTNIYYPAKNLTKQQCDQVRALGQKVAKVLGCDVLARVDFFNSPKGFIFIEANLIPGFTSHSLYPAMFQHSGTSYSDLLTKLIGLVLKD